MKKSGFLSEFFLLEMFFCTLNRINFLHSNFYVSQPFSLNYIVFFCVCFLKYNDTLFDMCVILEWFVGVEWQNKTESWLKTGAIKLDYQRT